jgi:hypothetical protein
MVQSKICAWSHVLCLVLLAGALPARGAEPMSEGEEPLSTPEEPLSIPEPPLIAQEPMTSPEDPQSIAEAPSGGTHAQNLEKRRRRKCTSVPATYAQ